MKYRIPAKNRAGFGTFCIAIMTICEMPITDYRTVKIGDYSQLSNFFYSFAKGFISEGVFLSEIAFYTSFLFSPPFQQKRRIGNDKNGPCIMNQCADNRI